MSNLAQSFFLGQVIGVVSLVPGGFGSSDAFWIAHLPLARSKAAAVLGAYRLIYYVIPWAIASLLLLSWVTRRAPRRLEIARRVVAGLVGGGGVLIMLSSASPALYARLPLLERFIPLPLVEAGPCRGGAGRAAAAGPRARAWPRLSGSVPTHAGAADDRRLRRDPEGARLGRSDRPRRARHRDVVAVGAVRSSESRRSVDRGARLW